MKRVFILLVSLTLVFAGCKTTRTQRGAVIGAGAGAAAGAIIGKTAGNTGVGAVIGATVGGVAGAIIGRQMDKQAEEIAREVPNAEVIHQEGEQGIIVNFNSKVLFGTDKSDLSKKSKNTIDDLATVLNKYPDTDLTIQGHTDSTGPDAYNQTLSEKRAQSVADYLRLQGVSADRLTAMGFGESQPIADNSTVEGRSENRRVSFVIVPNEKMKQEAIDQANQE